MSALPVEPEVFLSRFEEANRERFDNNGWSFTDGQEAAIVHGDEAPWITAGPGTVKTEILTFRALKFLLVYQGDKMCRVIHPVGLFGKTRVTGTTEVMWHWRHLKHRLHSWRTAPTTSHHAETLATPVRDPKPLGGK